MNTSVRDIDHDVFMDTSQAAVDSASSLSVDRVMRSLRNFATLSEALRLLGAGVIVASMSVFLLQGWSEGNDIRRYLMLLTQTGLLAAAGFCMSHVVKETKGARSFFGLALLSVPANFTILGALMYSVFQLDGGLTTYPGYADWRIDGAASIGATMGGAMIVLIPVTLLCFAIMARRSSGVLTVHFVVLNALLLVPIRSSVAAGTIALLGIAYAVFVIGKLAGKDPSLKTGEGKFALATLLIPPGIILFRSMYFYQVDSLMIAMLAIALFLAARQVSLFPGRHERFAIVLETVSWPLALTAGIALTDAISPIMMAELGPPVFAATYTALSADIIRRTSSQVLARLIGVSISLAVVVSFTFTVAFNPSAASALFSVLAGALLLMWGIADRAPVPMVAGVFTAGMGVMFGFDALLRLVVTSSWIDLAIFGALAIALGSVLDRHGVAIKLRLANWLSPSKKEPIALEE